MSACCGGETKRSVFVAREEKALDPTRQKVLLLHTGDEETNVTVNGRSYRLGTGQNRGIEVPQEDVEDLLVRGKFKIASDWYNKQPVVETRAELPHVEKTEKGRVADANNK